MKFEKSCGAVVYTFLEGQLRFVLVRSVHGAWGFPKGHMEPGESERQTAVREVHEETGLEVKLQGRFRIETKYLLPAIGAQKTVIWFLAQYQDQQLRLQPEEIADIRLCSLREGLALLPVEDLRRVLRAANRTIKKSL